MSICRYTLALSGKCRFVTYESYKELAIVILMTTFNCLQVVKEAILLLTLNEMEE
ncbi:hypothetical protein B7P43_G16643 [Cryptotermes secundus]|uniref:Uncharacterized protein n=1 Tax=Cryptotermes secundus TaxID=105785 RepID=A0A2J7Q802_9NEOP|nr:hypothetical protein B7P43_G16643 [Cryptotermes secundus]